MSRARDSPFDSPQPAECQYYPGCQQPAVHAVDVAVDDDETEEVKACTECAEEFVEPPVNSGRDVRDLTVLERWEDADDA